MSGVKGQARVLSRVYRVFSQVFTVIAAPSIAFIVANWLAKELELSSGWKIAIMVGLALLLGLGFLVVWAILWLKAEILNDPLPGLTDRSAEALVCIAAEMLPELPKRRRHRSGMAVRLGIVIGKLERLDVVLHYLINQRFPQLASELRKEEVFDPGSIQRLHQMVVVLAQDFSLFLEVATSSMIFVAEILDDSSSPHRLDTQAFDSVAQSLNRVTKNLRRLIQKSKAIHRTFRNEIEQSRLAEIEKAKETLAGIMGKLEGLEVGKRSTQLSDELRRVCNYFDAAASCEPAGVHSRIAGSRIVLNEAQRKEFTREFERLGQELDASAEALKQVCALVGETKSICRDSILKPLIGQSYDT